KMAFRVILRKDRVWGLPVMPQTLVVDLGRELSAQPAQLLLPLVLQGALMLGIRGRPVRVVGTRTTNQVHTICSLSLLTKRPCTCTLRINITGSPTDCHRGKKV